MELYLTIFPDMNLITDKNRSIQKSGACSSCFPTLDCFLAVQGYVYAAPFNYGLSSANYFDNKKVRYKNNKIADGGGKLNLAHLLEYNKIQISYSDKIRQEQDRIQSSSYHSRS